VLAVLLAAMWPPSAGDWFSYADLAPVRDRWFAVVTALSVGLILAVPAQALAAMMLARFRGAGWVTTGGVMMFAGTALQATGLAGWATLYYFATGPALDPATGEAFLSRIGADGLLFVVATPGAILIALGTAVQAVGLWRSRALPRWVPIVSLAILPTFFLPTESVAGVLGQIPISVSAAAIGWYAWRRTR
jgi:hypothetical protein